MSALLIGLALLCGIPPGFIAGLITGARLRRKIREQEFDGGFEVENPPPRAVTRIWFGKED